MSIINKTTNLRSILQYVYLNIENLDLLEYEIVSDKHKHLKILFNKFTIHSILLDEKNNYNGVEDIDTIFEDIIVLTHDELHNELYAISLLELLIVDSSINLNDNDWKIKLRT